MVDTLVVMRVDARVAWLADVKARGMVSSLVVERVVHSVDWKGFWRVDLFFIAYQEGGLHVVHEDCRDTSRKIVNEREQDEGQLRKLGQYKPLNSRKGYTKKEVDEVTNAGCRHQEKSGCLKIEKKGRIGQKRTV